ncbi:MAG: acetolactate synthase [Chloroflexi bacterium]|nr:acetolactate synthase [Chloroflexota bacterium]MBV9543997.1 acetolactate synthase [Chloroflexota bacterium]
MPTGGQAVVAALVAAGVDHAFCVPGESFLGLLDALYDSPIRVIATRHEGGAAFMAEAFGQLTRRPAVCMGTRMVGAGNLAIGIHTAHQNSSPMLAMLGQVGTEMRHREAFQEAELAQVFAPVAKWAVEPPRADRLGELTLRAARVALSGRQGPVVMSLREDLLADEAEAFEPPFLTLPRPAPEPGAVRRALALLREARRPVMLLGGGVLAARATDAFVGLAHAEQVPVIAAWRRPDVYPNDDPLFLGHGGLAAPRSLAQRLLEADVLLVVGCRLNEQTTLGYRVPAADARLIHVDLCAENMGGHRTADVPIQADAALFAEALLAGAALEPPPADLLELRRTRNATDRAAFEAQTLPRRGRARTGFLDHQALSATLRDTLPPDAVITTDAGNFGGWPARYLRWRKPGTFLGPTSGGMGYAVPSAIAARLAVPERPAVALVGDGGFLMTGNEVETAVRERAPIVALVYDNNEYGTIRMHQEREHPGRPIATALGPVDFAAIGRALGANGLSIRDEQEFGPALTAALADEKPSVLHLRVDPQQISVASDTA